MKSYKLYRDKIASVKWRSVERKSGITAQCIVFYDYKKSVYVLFTHSREEVAEISPVISPPPLSTIMFIRYSHVTSWETLNGFS
jgi:hypothetical protein